MKPIFQENLKFGDIWPWNCQKVAQIEIFGHFFNFASLVFLDFAHNDRWVLCLVAFLQFAGPVIIFLFVLYCLDLGWENYNCNSILGIWLKSISNLSLKIITNIYLSLKLFQKIG